MAQSRMRKHRRNGLPDVVSMWPTGEEAGGGWVSVMASMSRILANAREIHCRPFGRRSDLAQRVMTRINRGRATNRRLAYESSNVQSGWARPTIDENGIGPKYRPSSDDGSSQFMRKI